MRLRPGPKPPLPTLNVARLTTGIEDLLIEADVYRNPANRRAAAENLTYAVARVWRGSERSNSSTQCIDEVDAAKAIRRLHRAADLFRALADRLED